ncbi:TetR/AcrR family transcriptional regulator [Stappia sp.]|uniref:TetR/AcrR family transcriptional regulator n=1 Tax=Stappia sp. TaxID=1870903 RepID=UPI003A99789D
MSETKAGKGAGRTPDRVRTKRGPKAGPKAAAPKSSASRTGGTPKNGATGRGNASSLPQREASDGLAAGMPKTARGAATRRAILEAAERVIGRQGFNEASIGSITREAGVAQGTFYIYFASKDEVFSELVAEMGRMLRHAISEATSGYADRLAAEREGLRAFLGFVSAHPELYRIVQEAQFVDPAAYLAYFRTFADGYRVGLERAAGKGAIRPGDAEVRAWALMGIARSLGEFQVVFGGQTPLDAMVEVAHDLIENGLKARDGEDGAGR